MATDLRIIIFKYKFDKNYSMKIAAIGIREKKWIAYHGFSLNVCNDLSRYNGIVPCGIKDKGITNLKKLGIKKYNNIDKAYFHTDFHMHSTWTDGKKTIIEMVDQAKKISLTDIAITDHIRETSTYFPKYYDE